MSATESVTDASRPKRRRTTATCCGSTASSSISRSRPASSAGPSDRFARSTASASRSRRARRSASSGSPAAERRRSAGPSSSCSNRPSGQIVFDGQDITGYKRKQMRAVRRDIQIVFQDPYASLNPRMTVRDIVAEPLKIHGLYRRGEGTRRVEELLRTGRAQPGAREPLPARVLGRAAPAHRRRACARAQPADDGARRAGIGARRVDPGTGREPPRASCRGSSGSLTSSSPTISRSSATSRIASP